MDNINPEILSLFRNKNAYLSDCELFDKTFIPNENINMVLNNYFLKNTLKIKSIYDTVDIDDNTLNNIKSDINNVIQEIESLESQHEKELIELIKTFINHHFNIKGVHLDLELKRASELNVNNDNYKFEDNIYDTYEEIFNENKKFQKDKLFYAFLCGASVYFLKEIFSDIYGPKLYLISPDLYFLYKKYVYFNDYYLWQTSDLDLDDHLEKLTKSHLEENYIKIDAPNFPIIIQELILNLFKKELNYTFDGVEEANNWNYRVGCVLWDNFAKNIQFDNFLKYVKRLFELDFKDLNFVFREMMFNTKHFNKMMNTI